MTTYPIKIIQVFRVEREIIVDVEAESEDDAVELQQEEDAPSVDDPGWKSPWTLENEEVYPAG